MGLSIRKKLIIFYIALILLPLILINYLAISNVTETVFHEVEVNSLKTANIIANLSKDSFQDIVGLKRIVKQYVPTSSGRLLILDSQQSVIVDSFNQMEGELLNSAEVKVALSNQEKIGYYRTYQRILQVAVPIVRTEEGERRVLGAIVFSTSVEAAFQQVEEFQRQLFITTLIALLMGTLVTIVASNRLTRPILTLSSVAKRIGEGELGQQVSITSKDEIGRLAENFNYMSSALYRIDRGRTQFIGDISHELKTPLASMKALIDSLLYGEDNIEIFREYLRDMDEEIDRLSALIKSLLNLTKLEELGINASQQELSSIVNDSLKILKHLMDKYNVIVTVKLEKNIALLCDVDRIKEVLINLVDNAIKYRDNTKNQCRICITGKMVKDYYNIIIEDNGIGIAVKDLESIFEKFYRSDTSRSRETGGAGIGLSIVNRIIKLHKWQIRVESELGEGTSFVVEIPKDSFKISL